MNPKNLGALRARLSEIDSELRGIDGAAVDRNLDETEQTRWDELDTELAQVRADIEECEAAEARAARVAESRAKWGSLQVAPTNPSPFENVGDISRMADEELQDRAVSAIESVAYRGLAHVRDEHRENATRKIEEHPGAARMALVTASPEYMSAFNAYMRAGAAGQSPVYTPEEAHAMRASLSLTSANGGYALPFLLDPTLIHTGAATKNPIRRIARVESGTQDKWHGVTVGAVTTYWKAEGSAFTDGSPTSGGVTIDAAMLTAYVTGSFEIFADSSWQQQLPGLIFEAVDYAEGTAFISGSGSDAPKGVITAISATAGCIVTATTRGSFTSASAVDTLALLNSTAVRYEDSSTFVMNKATYRTINQQIIGTDGVKVIDMTDRNNLLDLPVVRASDMPSATTSGNALIVLGDFSQYIVYDRLGVNVEFIANVVDGDGLPTGKRGLVAYKRVGADVSDLNAFRYLKA